MNLARLALAGLRHHRRAHLGVLAGFTVAAAVLVGALLVGDSVRGSLRARAAARVGDVTSVIAAEDRAFRGALADELAEELADARVAAVLAFSGHAAADGGARRANELSVLGIDGRFLELAPAASAGPPAPGSALLADAVARRLEVEKGDEVLLRVPAPSALPRDMVLAPTEDATRALRVEVAGVVGPDDFARFGLSVGPRPPGNVFVDRAWLAAELELSDVANLLVTDAAADATRAALAERWRLADAQLEVRTREDGTFELTTPRVFLDAPVERAARELGRPALGVLTYFVNAIESEHASTPYSMVAAVGDLGVPTGWVDEVVSGEGIVLNEWTAGDHGGEVVGTEVELAWWVPGPDRKLVEDRRSFPVARVVPLEVLAADADLMPPFPGLAGEEHCRDWDPGVAIDLDRIREKDEAYWDEHRGTPKAFLPLEVGQELWANRFGTLTAVRAPDPGGDYAEALRAGLAPGDFGLSVRDLAGSARAGTDTPTDFGGLFLGLSFFLIAAALLLAGLLFVFGVEQRASEMGTLLAIGWPKPKVRRLLLLEAGTLALAGAVLGAGLGTLYTRAVLAGLASVWSGAVASTPIDYHGRATTLVLGAAGAFVAALLAARLALRWLGRRSMLELLGASPGLADLRRAAGVRRRRVNLVVLAGGLVGALVLAATAGGTGSEEAGAFFGAAALLLVAALSAARLVLARFESRARPAGSVLALGTSGAARRPGRSTTTVALLAAGTFLVVSIGVHRRSGVPDPTDPASGTGGFTLVGRSTLPVHERLDSAAGRDAHALPEDLLEGVEVLHLRRLDGDDASCLNLGAPQRPRLLGVDAAALAGRDAFTFTETTRTVERPWELLTTPLESGAVPAVGDAASIRWTMKRAVGDELTYVDGRGESFQVRIVGAVEDSILQGSLLVDEAAFRERFPDVGGWQEFLIDAPPERMEEVSRTLTRALGQEGLALEPAAERLQAYRRVQNTYLDIFQLLGALGVLLGSVGVGVVVLRNALERRRELAALSALGYTRGALFRLLAGEHGLLLVLGLGAGVVAAALALLPVVAPERAAASVGPLVLAMVLNGAFWVAVATWGAVRGVGPADLRNE